VSHLETLAELTAILRGEVLGQHCQAHPHLVAYRRVAAQMLQVRYLVASVPELDLDP
jgi:hypothetical protein